MTTARWMAVVLILGGGTAFLHGAWIPVKAWVAQQLLDHAWQQRRAGEPAARPWPWADTHPLARLRQARLGIDQVVLAGTSGRVLAFGPGHLPGSAAPGDDGNVVLSGHRDTHFAWLQHLGTGDELVLETPAGRRMRYAVWHTEVVDQADTAAIYRGADVSMLRLVTCYPFAAVTPGGRQRYVVSAIRL